MVPIWNPIFRRRVMGIIVSGYNLIRA